MALPRADILAPQTIRRAICLVLASAGIKIPIIIATNGNKTTGKAIPVMARPLPFNRPELLLIFTKAIIPKIIAGSAVKKHANGLKIASTRAAIASPLVLASGFSAVTEVLVKTQLQA
jgi:hypothetical protein